VPRIADSARKRSNPGSRDGFSSVIFGQVLDDEEIPTSAAGNFQGYDDTGNWQQDSLYGIQFRAELEDGLSATGQITGRGYENYDATVTWAYLTYQFNEEFSIKAGRQRLPYYMYSDFLDVGYAYHWISPPTEVYAIGQFDNFDGISFEYLTEIRNWTSRLSLSGGSTTTIVDIGTTSSEIKTQEFIVFAWSLNYDWFTLRLGHSQTDVSLDFYTDFADNIDRIISINGPGLTAEQYKNLSAEGKRTNFDSLGLTGDWGRFFAIAEYKRAQVEDAPFSVDNSAWYLSGGIRHNQFTFHFTYAEEDMEDNEKTVEAVQAVRPTLQQIAGGVIGNALEQATAAQLLQSLDILYLGGFELGNL